MNIDSRDLRLGNLMYDAQNIIREVEAIHPEIIHFKNSGSNRVEVIKPVSLTDDILLDCGFKKYGGNYHIELASIKSEIHFEVFRKELVCTVYSSTGCLVPSAIKHLHTLQNLIKLLTGNDLDVSKLTNKI